MDIQKTKRSLEASKLEAEAKALRRAEKAFWSEVEERLDEIREKYMSDTWDEICRTYGLYTDEKKAALYKHVTSQKQIDYYKNYVLKAGTENVSSP